MCRLSLLKNIYLTLLTVVLALISQLSRAQTFVNLVEGGPLEAGEIVVVQDEALVGPDSHQNEPDPVLDGCSTDFLRLNVGINAQCLRVNIVCYLRCATG